MIRVRTRPSQSEPETIAAKPHDAIARRPLPVREAPHGRRAGGQADERVHQEERNQQRQRLEPAQAETGRHRGHQDGDNQPPNEIGAKPPQAGEQRVHLFQVPHIGFKRRISVNPEGS
jgi:hypothetical protein